MASPASEDQDLRNNAGLEDLTTMTIESLRARLLSERAISKSSRQRADELAKRVLELEEQLKMVSLQRKKAEKATADVLAILESNGISDASDAYDSNSDQETTIDDSKVSSDRLKRMETPINFEGRRSDVEAYSSSEIDSSPSTGRSLSWKSSKDSPHPLQRKKYMETVRRRCSTFTSNGSLPKRVGKSCRRIRRRETRSVPEQLQNDADMHDLQGNTVDEFSKDSPNSADIKHPANHGVGNAYYSNGNGDIEDMEGRLEHEAEDKPHREWEEKVRENSRTVLDSYDPGNRSDVTEDREEMKTPGQLNPDWAIDAQNLETNLVNTNFTEEPELKVAQRLPQFENAYLQDQNASKTVTPGSTSLEFSFSTPKGGQGQLFSGNLDKSHLQGSHTSSNPNGSYGIPSMHRHTLATKDGESSGSRKELAMLPQKSSNNIESVLESLQQARLSLNQMLCSTALSEIGSSVNGIELSVPGIRTAERMKASFGCPGLFRLPTDFWLEGTATVNHLGSNSGLVSCYPDPACERFLGSPYEEPRSSALFGNQFYTSSGVEIGSEVPRPTQTPTPAFPHGVSGLHTSAMPYMEIKRSSTPPLRLVRENAFATSQSSSGRSAYLDPEMKSGLVPGLHASSTPFSWIQPTLTASRPVFDTAFDAIPSSFARSSYLDPQMSPGLVLPSRYTYPTYPLHPEVPPTTNERLSRNVPSMEYGMPSAAARIPLCDDHIGHMYK